MNINDFYIIAREPGAQNPSIPTWASRNENALDLNYGTENKNIIRREVEGVPGAYQLVNVFSDGECLRIINRAESLGFLEDAAVSLPREVRHNDSVTLIVDETTEQLIWQRVEALVSQNLDLFEGKKPLGINARFRFYRYQVGDYFKYHTDGDWPGSKVVDGKLVHNAFDDRYSRMTFLILLNDDFDGGETRFLVNAKKSGLPLSRNDKTCEVDVRTPAGGILIFPHGSSPMHALHSSLPITKGVKYIIRTDLLFEL